MTIASDRAYQTLKARILNGALKPGDRLVERRLCEDLDMSRTPVREALRRLTADGLVTMKPHAGITVAHLDSGEIEEIFEFGVVMESFIAALAASKAKSAQIKQLRDLLSDMEQELAADMPNMGAYSELDQKLHTQVAVMADNERLSTLLRQTMDSLVIPQAFASYEKEDYRRSLEQHRTIVDAIEAGDAEWAQSAMRGHILSGRGALRRALALKDGERAAS